MTRGRRSIFWAAVLAGALAACGSGGGDADGGADGAGPTVYATTGYIADAVLQVAPDAVVTTMVGPGGDPHTFQPSTRDIEAIQGADLVLWNGHNLEAHLIDQLRSLGDGQVALAEELPEDLLIPLPESDGAGFDPHVWNSPEAWTLVVSAIADALSEVDPDRSEEYEANAEQFQAEIAAVHEESVELMATVAEPRILVTGHDAFAYFGATYDLEVHATDFISTDAVLSPTEISELADLIAENEIPVIFQDNQANPQAITSLSEAVHARGWAVEISDAEMYADSLGAEEGVDTYLGVFRHNVSVVVDALGEPAS